MDNSDFRTDLEMWQDIWDDAQKQNVHPPIPKLKGPDLGAEAPQDHYFDYLDSEAEVEVLHEQKLVNPVYPDSVGPDSELEPRWGNEEFLKEIQGMKDKLFKLENQLAKMQCGKKLSEKAITQNPQVAPSDNNIMSEIQALRKKMDKVSSRLGIEDEPSPWEIKRD